MWYELACLVFIRGAGRGAGIRELDQTSKRQRQGDESLFYLLGYWSLLGSALKRFKKLTTVRESHWGRAWLQRCSVPRWLRLGLPQLISTGIRPVNQEMKGQSPSSVEFSYLSHLLWLGAQSRTQWIYTSWNWSWEMCISQGGLGYITVTSSSDVSLP